MWLKKQLKKRLLHSNSLLWMLQDRKNFHFFQARGIHVVPNHFYQPVPDTSTLTESFLSRQDDLTGLRMNDAEQQALLRELIRNYKAEYSSFPFAAAGDPEQYYWDNGSFQCLDAVMLYGILRKIKPKTLIEIGCGFSTRLSLTAIALNRQEGHATRMRCIEPYPNPVVANLLSRHMELTSLPVQKIPLSWFKELNPGDILFIDTSHVLKTGSDVHYYFEAVLPHVPAGVWVHFHDIFIPEEYPRHWIMDDLKFYNEQYILRAFLSFNDSFRIMLAGRYLQIRYPELVQEALDFYPAPLTTAGSFWIYRER